jgi:hypothetical protein
LTTLFLPIAPLFAQGLQLGVRPRLRGNLFLRVSVARSAVLRLPGGKDRRFWPDFRLQIALIALTLPENRLSLG